MESVHGIDVSWIHNTRNKDSPGHARVAAGSPPKEVNSTNPATNPTATPNGSLQPKDIPSAPKQIPQRPGFAKSSSTDKVHPVNGSFSKSPTTSPGPTSSRRNSWLSSISSKFSSSPGAQHPPASLNTQPVPEPVLKPIHHTPPKNAVLPHGTKPDGAAPYTPAPPGKSGQAGFLQSALRRLSSSGGQLSGGANRAQHGLCQRRILNVDHQRERCDVPNLDSAKLRRVAFCVDVEIASGPRYQDEEGDDRKKEKKQKKKIVEKGEGEALKHPQEVKDEKENDGVLSTGEHVPKEPEVEATSLPEGVPEEKVEVEAQNETGEKDTTKKKEKKKRSEEERKARKEKKRRQAEANGILPVELMMNGSESSLDTPSIAGTPKTQASPTTDPLRIYRRCCQLRETPILKKITEQLASPLNCGIEKAGVVTKLDLSEYWMQLPDLVTLGDYLAVVPVKELVMERCGLTDEGVRVILAGLLAAKAPDRSARRRNKSEKGQDVVHHTGVVERVVFKNNPKIGREGWNHVALFMHMSRSLKQMDMSMNAFPQTVSSPLTLQKTPSGTSVPTDTSCVLSEAIATRKGGSELELLNMAETGLTADQLGHLVDGVIKSGLRRLGLAGNRITEEGVQHVARFLKEGRCAGLDLGGNDLRDHLDIIADALDEDHPLWALSLANCDLTPESLSKLLPALAKLKNFRFIDFSHNHDMFATNPTALSLLRRYIPRMPVLKRIHLTDTSMSPEHAISIAEISSESSSLAHINIMENPELTALASAKDEANQEEACALYASLMAAARVSKTLVCIDIEVPSLESSEVVKALAKQVVAYCLRNMERGPVAEITQDAGDKEVAVPDVLLHLVGHVEGFHENHDEDEPAPDQDYIVGGTGVVKALGICLRNNANHSRRPSSDRSVSGEIHSPVPGGKAKHMSKNLLGSARKIRARLQPALIKERTASDPAAYQRLMFLDTTLERMIQRFEDEYPETRLPTFNNIAPALEGLNASPLSDTSIINGEDIESSMVMVGSDEEESRPKLSRHNSDVSLASKALSDEEGRVHRFGQRFRRDILKPDTEDHIHGTTGREVWAPHLQMLRGTIEELGGDEIKKKIEEGGEEALIKELTEEASALRKKLIESDPEGWESFRQSQEAAIRNTHVAGSDMNQSAIE